jgi:alkylated DNA repair dioxygenase AlkB
MKLDGSRMQPYATGDPQMTVSADVKRQLKAFVSGISWNRHRPNEPSSDYYDPDRPPWMSWPTLEAILLETGRYRDQQAKQVIANTGA